MNKSLQKIVTWVVVGVLVLQFSGCSLGWEASSRAKVTDEQLFPTVARLIEEQKDVVWAYLDEDVAKTLKGELPQGLEIVENTLAEDHGRDYLEFCYAVSQGNDENQVETVVEFAKDLISAEEMVNLESKLQETRSIMMQNGENLAKGLAPSQRAAFWKDMQKMVTRTLVLFAAGIVYAFIPNVVFWGKVTAASAVALAAGVVASSIMSLWRYYQFGGNLDESFNEWLMTVTTEPEVSFAMASSMLAVGKTLKRGPVVTGIVICVFALYNIIDMVKPMLKEYNFTV
ncbi:hypothetical protein SpiGrapes_2488 [Sphaerochaeta pleomorpha str. Grapes]|uniref:Uncharacterized protein n=1 Tax=Sphaerochaeta pleomorpha (strain ATCC BAA-1885 / DSM 22778 / Grapes) TaxID=158190 RepID=G8QU02_SPHPG|nr:hypothetical protein [Sphaerochaeta pleomorpha]AEV30249.1 hypothetical protein SpiGrapes_2488 [Sphaerochaeta pleomorpha str. Grapes]